MQPKQLINLTRQQKEFVADALLNGKKIDKYLLTFGVIHPIELPIVFETEGKGVYLPDSEQEIDLENVQTTVIICLPRINWNMVNGVGKSNTLNF